MRGDPRLARPGSGTSRVLRRLTYPSVSRRSQRGQRRSLTVEHRLQRGHQMLELGPAHMGKEMLPQPLHENARGSTQGSAALGGEGSQVAAFVALEDTPLHEALSLELIDGPGDATGRQNHP